MKGKIITLALAVAVATSVAVLLVTQPKETEVKPNTNTVKSVAKPAGNAIKTTVDNIDIATDKSEVATNTPKVVANTPKSKADNAVEKSEKKVTKTEPKAKKKNDKGKNEEPSTPKEEPVPTPRLGYTVRYVDTNGNDIADIKLVTDFENGAFVKEVAPTIEGYEFDSYQITGHSEYLPGYTFNNLGERESIFRVYDGDVVYIMYREIEKPSYTVKYIDVKTNDEIVNPRVVTDFVEGEMVTEYIPTIEGYEFHSVETAWAGDATEFTFEAYNGDVVYVKYRKVERISYTVKYIDKTTENEVTKSETGSWIKGDTFTRYFNRTIDGYNYNGVRYNGKTYTTNYIVVDNLNDGDVIEFLLTPKEYVSYTVKYVDMDTHKEIADNRVVTGFAEGEMVTEYIPTIDGYKFYDVVGDTTEFTFEANDGDVVYVRYYKDETISYTVKYVDVNGNEIAPSKSVNYIGAATRVIERPIDIDGYKPNRYNVSHNIIENQTITFTYSEIVK